MVHHVVVAARHLDAGIPAPIANSFGWIFTEMGRQPWVVFGVLQTADGVSPGVSQGEVITSLSLFTAVYEILAIVGVRLLAKYANAGAVDEEPPRKDPTLRPRTATTQDSRRRSLPSDGKGSGSWS
ncbi:cytochrome ubiquinol oxidase subunit I [Yinghuangia aomiensis]